VLKGDLPIGVSLSSVEVWSHPSWFDKQYTVGAPPDNFSPLGQNWGFPIYRWEEMERDGYRFWWQRLTHLFPFIQALRLDHVLGFFRLWAIPESSVTAIQGRFIPSLPLSRKELNRWGITDIEALCIPLITDELLRHLFGPHREEIIAYYLEPMDKHRYRFRPPFTTERGMLSTLRPGERYVVELLRLHNEVLFLPERRGDETFYHPRIGMEDTQRFHNLPEETQLRLTELTNDYFYRRHDALWDETGRKRLKALQAMTGLLLCGEDLGMVPSIVRPALQELGILSLRIERFPTARGEILPIYLTTPTSPSLHLAPMIWLPYVPGGKIRIGH